ncbi:MAG: sulfotransferase [Anaerolineales bacterium]|nr:sulfotransferase [Anaerolineales bacterium]
MTYNLKLFWRMAYRSFFDNRGTPGEINPKRLGFILLFYAVWPAWALFTTLCFKLDDLLFAGHKDQIIDKPLFILGNFRSGSTFLHRLLSRDSNFTSLTTWDIYITPTVTQRKIVGLVKKVDNVLGGHLKRLILLIDRLTLGQVQIHRISFFEPEEDENILLHAWSSYFTSVLFPFLDELPPYNFFDKALPAGDRNKIMAFYHSCLQRHLYAAGGNKRFVSKNPAFSPKIETLAEFFPDARIIYLVRNPLDMLPSTVSWLSYITSVFNHQKEKYLHQSMILEMTQYWYRHPLKYIDEHPSKNHLILKYDDLIGQPEQVIRDFYDQFEYPDKPDLDNIVNEAMEESRIFRSDHFYSYEEMGYTYQQIVNAYADIFKRFNFDERTPITAQNKLDHDIELTTATD